MIYEVINPSDAVTFEAPSDVVAQAAVIRLGRGCYGCRSEDDRDVLPILAFCSDEVIKAWADEHREISELPTTDEGRLAIAAALESTAVCSLADRPRCAPRSATTPARSRAGTRPGARA